jgi:hypothetical protein
MTEYLRRGVWAGGPRPRRVLLSILLAVSISFLLSAEAGAQGATETPEVYSEWHAQQIADLDDLFAATDCPPIDGLVFDDREVTTTQTTNGFLSENESVELLVVADQPTLRCNYIDQATNQSAWVQVRFGRLGSGDVFACSAEASESTSSASLGQLEDGVAVEGSLGFGSATKAFTAQLEAATGEIGRSLAVGANGCVDDPIAISCPDMAGYPSVEASINGFYGGQDTYGASCTYVAETSGEGAPPNIEVTVGWAPEGATSSPQRVQSICSDEDEFEGGWGRIAGAGVAASVTYGISSAVPIDTAPTEAVALDLLSQASAQAQPCAGVEIIPFSQQFTPVAASIAAAFTPQVVSGPTPPMEDSSDPATGSSEAPPEEPDEAAQPSEAGEPPPAADDSDSVAPSASETGDDSGGAVDVLLSIVAVVLVVLSVLGLGLAFLLISRESRVRPRFDVIRLVLMLGSALLMLVVFSRDTAAWAIAIGVAVGLVLGFLQGRNLAIRVAAGKVMAKRTAWAVAAFAVSLIVSLMAGLLNRSGAVSFGVALSFLAAALTAGLLVGRQPRIGEARRAAGLAVLLLVLAAPLVQVGMDQQSAVARQNELSGSTDGLDLGAVPPDQWTADHQTLIDAVPWEEATMSGGLWWQFDKPWTSAPMPRALTALPEPVTRTVEWSHLPTSSSPGPTAYSVTETFEFTPRADGWCCSVTYSGEGTETPFAGEPENWVVSGQLDDLHSVMIEGSGPFNPNSFGGQPFTEVGEWGAPEGSEESTICRRGVGMVRNERMLENSGGAADVGISVDGVAQDTSINAAVVIGVPCDLPDLSLESVLATAPPPPSQDDPERAGCPVTSEVLGALGEGTTFEGFDSRTITEAALEPNVSLCMYGALASPPAIGQGGKGQTRIEFAIDVATPRRGEWDPGYDRWGARDNQLDLFSPTDIPVEERCELDSGGDVIEPPPGRTCNVVSVHEIPLDPALGARFQDGATAWLWTFREWQLFDGPNAQFQAAFPWASYYVRCHHCLLDSPEIVAFLTRLHGFYTQGFGSFGGDEPAASPPEPADPAAPEEPAETADAADDAASSETALDPTSGEDDLTDEAAVAAILVALAAAGIALTSLSESGIPAADLLEAWRREGATGVRSRLDETEAVEAPPPDGGEPDTGEAASEAEDELDEPDEDRPDEDQPDRTETDETEQPAEPETDTAAAGPHWPGEEERGTGPGGTGGPPGAGGPGAGGAGGLAGESVEPVVAVEVVISKDPPRTEWSDGTVDYGEDFERTVWVSQNTETGEHVERVERVDRNGDVISSETFVVGPDGTSESLSTAERVDGATPNDPTGYVIEGEGERRRTEWSDGTVDYGEDFERTVPVSQNTETGARAERIEQVDRNGDVISSYTTETDREGNTEVISTSQRVEGSDGKTTGYQIETKGDQNRTEWSDGTVSYEEQFERTVEIDPDTVRTEQVDTRGRVLRSETVRTNPDQTTEVIQRVERVPAGDRAGPTTDDTSGYRIEDYPER